MKFVFVVGLMILCAGCAEEATSDRDQRVKQEQLSQESNAQVGMPGVANFTEKRMVRML